MISSYKCLILIIYGQKLMFKNFFVGAFLATFFAFNFSLRASDSVDDDVSADEYKIGDFPQGYNPIIQKTFDKLSLAMEALKEQIAIFKPWKALYDEKNQPKDYEEVFILEIEDPLEHRLSRARLRIQKEYRLFRDNSDNYLNQHFISAQKKLNSMKEEYDFLFAFIYEGKAINQNGIEFLDSIVAKYIEPSWSTL
jgi:hypothetical protein